MSNQYRAVSTTGEARFGTDVFEAEFTVDDEQDWLNRGVLELVPRPYRVLSDNYSIEGWPVPQDAIVEAAFPIEHEAAMLAGGHLERVRRDAKPTVDPESVQPAPKKAPAKRATTSKE